LTDNVNSAWERPDVLRGRKGPVIRAWCGGLPRRSSSWWNLCGSHGTGQRDCGPASRTAMT